MWPHRILVGSRQENLSFVIRQFSIVIFWFGSIGRGVVLVGTRKISIAKAAADAFQERLVLFAVRIIDLVTRLPRATAGRHVAGQVLRSGTSPAPNFAEARGAEGRVDFVHKFRIAVKERIIASLPVYSSPRSGPSWPKAHNGQPLPLPNVE